MVQACVFPIYQAQCGPDEIGRRGITVTEAQRRGIGLQAGCELLTGGSGERLRIRTGCPGVAPDGRVQIHHGTCGGCRVHAPQQGGRLGQQGRLSQGQAAELLGMCERNFRRYIDRYRREGLEGLRLNTSVSGIHPGPVPNQVQRGTILFDAVYLAAADKLKREVGRKVIVLITDGMDQGSRVKIDKAIEAAQKSDAIIYSIFYEDPYFRARNRGYFANDSALKKLSEETGGRVFHVGGKLSLDGIFDQIQQEMRSQYAITYTPTNPQKDGSYRKVEIKLANKDLKPQARKGYYATPNSN